MRKPRLTLEALEARAVPATLASQVIPNVAGDQFGTGVAALDTGSGYAAYLSGRTTANGDDGLALRVNTPYSLAAGSVAFNTQWPLQANGDSLNAVAVAPTGGVYLGGHSHSQTTDTVGGKEHKGVVVGLSVAGTPNWVRQAPNAPGAFTYGGYEKINDITAVVENGTTVLYATGSSQSNGVNGGRTFLTKVTAGGAVQWTRTDTPVTPNSDGYDVIVSNGFVYVAGLTNDGGTRQGYVRKYDTAGNLVWSNATAAGMFTSIVADASGNLYVGGNTNGANTDFLLQKWTADGSVKWSRTFDRSAAADAINGLTVIGPRLYAVGETRGGTAGGSDGVVLTFDTTTGNLLEQNLWGGAGDDSLQDVTAINGTLHVAGTARSFGSNGADLAYSIWTLNEAPRGVALSPASVPENRPAGTAVGTLTATDPNAGDTHTFTLASGGVDNAAFALVGNSLRTAASFDFEVKSSYSIRVRVTDAGGLWVEQNLTVTVTDVNEAPAFDLTASALPVPNNTPAQSVLNWAYNRTNPEAAQTLTFEIVSNTNPALFASAPTIAPDGTLNYTPQAGATGSATIAVRLRDNGGTANGGVDVSPTKTFTIEVVRKNLALNTARLGLPSPLSSDAGWGGGSDMWDVADGQRSYPTWARGLAFTGGSGNYAGQPAGVRQVTVELAAADWFGEVFVWHHGSEHAPAVAALEYYNASGWHPITFTRQWNASSEMGNASGGATADRYTFTPVFGSKVRYSFDNSQASMTGAQNVHGWVYEIEVISAPGGPVTDPNGDGGGTGGGQTGGGAVVGFLPPEETTVREVATAAFAPPVEAWDGFGLGDDDGVFFPRV